MYKLSNNSSFILRKFDNARIPVDNQHPEYQNYLDWVQAGNVIEPADIVVPELVSPKMQGIEFQGVMCSATKEDQDGLLAVLVAYQMQAAGFKPTLFVFKNRSELLIDVNNIQAFISTWMPFRQSFFLPTETENAK